MKPRQPSALHARALPANSRRPAWRRDLLSQNLAATSDSAPVGAPAAKLQQEDTHEPSTRRPDSGLSNLDSSEQLFDRRRRRDLTIALDRRRPTSSTSELGNGSAPRGKSAATNSQTPAGRNLAEGGDRRPLPSPLKSVGRRTFCSFAAFLGGALAWGAHKRANPTDRHAEPYTGPLTLEHHTPKLVQTHAENSGAPVQPGKLSLTVEYGEPMNIGGVSFREIRGVRRIS